MRSHRWLAVLVISSVLGSGVFPFDPALAGSNSSRAAAQDLNQPAALMTGLQLADSARYSVTILKPDTLVLRDVRVEVTLPPDAEFLQAVEVPGSTHFEGLQASKLSWTAREVAASDDVDAFAFTLRQVPAGDFQVDVHWGGAQPGQNGFSGHPPLSGARAAAGELTLGPEGTGGRLVPIGDSGVLVWAPTGVLPEDTTIGVRRLGPEANPSPAELGDLWWCAMVEVTGLPDSADLVLFVPLRQPLPPLANISLFAQDAGQWQPLGWQGFATPDGQYVVLRSAGSKSLAAGTSPARQPRLPTAGPTPTPIAGSGTTPRSLPSNLTRAAAASTTGSGGTVRHFTVNDCENLIADVLKNIGSALGSQALTNARNNLGGGHLSTQTIGQRCSDLAAP